MEIIFLKKEKKVEFNGKEKLVKEVNRFLKTKYPNYDKSTRKALFFESITKEEKLKYTEELKKNKSIYKFDSVQLKELL